MESSYLGHLLSIKLEGSLDSKHRKPQALQTQYIESLQRLSRDVWKRTLILVLKTRIG
jgi:hypothetical protein